MYTIHSVFVVVVVKKKIDSSPSFVYCSGVLWSSIITDDDDDDDGRSNTPLSFIHNSRANRSNQHNNNKLLIRVDNFTYRTDPRPTN